MSTSGKLTARQLRSATAASTSVRARHEGRRGAFKAVARVAPLLAVNLIKLYARSAKPAANRTGPAATW